MARFLILLSLLTISSFALAQNTRLKAELIITGEIVESGCNINPYQKTKNNFIDNCGHKISAGKISSKVKMTSKKILLTNNNAGKKNKQSQPNSYATIYLAEYK